MTTTYLAAVQQIWGHYDSEGDWQDGVNYLPHGDPFADRAALVAVTTEELGHDDLNVATLVDARLVAFGWGGNDFGPDEDGAPHNGHDLNEVARASVALRRGR